MLVLPALVLTAFSLRPSVLPRSAALAPDAFDAVAARGDLRSLAAIPDRTPGSPGDERAARLVADRFRSAGLKVSIERAESPTIAGDTTTTIVRATRTGFSQRRVVIAADRVSPGKGNAGLTGTAALLELGRAIGGRTLAHSVEFVSTGAGPGGALAEWVPRGGPVVSVLVLGDLSGSRLAAPYSVPWAQLRATAAPVALERSVASAIAAETGFARTSNGFFDRALRLALPITTTGQGPLVAEGFPAVTMSSSGERGPDPDSNAGPRFDAFGRAALRVAGVLDGASGGWPGRDSGALPLRDRELPEWTIRLIAAMAVLSALATGIDGLARARRRKVAVLEPMVWLVSPWPAFLIGCLWLLFSASVGMIPGAPGATAPPGSVPVSWPAVAGVPVAIAFGWLVLRPLTLKLAGRTATAGPGCPAALMLIGAVAAGMVAVRDPLTALLLMPFVHLGPWLADPARAPSRRSAALVLIAVAAPFVVVLAFLGADFSTGPLQLAWMIALIFAGGSAGIGGVLITTLFAALFVSVSILAAMPRPEPDAVVTTRGPVSYAGPGSLGGTG